MSVRRRARDPLVWVFLLTAAIAVLGIVDLALEIGQPYGGYVSYRRAAVATGEVDANTPVWWPGMIGDQLGPGADLLAVDGQPYYPNVRAAFVRAAAEGRRFVTITFQTSDNPDLQTSELPVDLFTLADFFDVRLPDLIMGGAFWLLALVVYFSEPDNPTYRAFALASALVGMLRVLYVHNLFLDDTLATVVETILLASIPMLGVALLYFAANFPVSGGRKWRLLIAVALVIAVISSVSAVLARLAFLPSETVRLFSEINYYLTVTLYLMGVFALTGRLTRRLIGRRHLSRRERRILVFVLAGLAVAMPMLLVSAFTWATIFGRQLTYYVRGLDLRYLLLAVPLTFAYALVRYRSLRAPSLLFIFVMLVSFSAIVAAVGAWVWTWSHANWPDNGLRPPFTSLFIAALVSSLVWGGAASTRGIFGRVLHYDQRSYGAARNFGRRITARTDMKALPATVTEALVQEMELERAALWLREESGEALALAGQHGAFRQPPPAVLSPADSSPHRRRAALSGAPLRLDRAEALPDWLQPIADGREFEIALPLIADGSLIGLIGLGPRWDEGIFDDRNLEAAELIGQQATLFLVAAAGMTELRRVPGRMADVQDRERQRLAQELHDTIQQFLGRLPFYLAVSRDAVRPRPDEAREILDRTISDVEEAAAAVRLIRHDLAPSRLERGLAISVAALCHNFEQRSGIRANVEIDPEVDARTNTEVRYAVYRVIQQALDNVEAHAGASAVTVRLAADTDFVTFAVRDDGRGSTEAERQAAKARGSYGLESMRARLEANGGRFQVWSAPGGGTEISGRAPAVARPLAEIP